VDKVILEARRDAAERAVKAASAALRRYPRDPLGLTPDAVKASPAWRADKARYDNAFRALQAANTELVRANRLRGRAKPGRVIKPTKGESPCNP